MVIMCLCQHLGMLRISPAWLLGRLQTDKGESQVSLVMIAKTMTTAKESFNKHLAHAHDY